MRILMIFKNLGYFSGDITWFFFIPKAFLYFRKNEWNVYRWTNLRSGISFRIIWGGAGAGAGRGLGADAARLDWMPVMLVEAGYLRVHYKMLSTFADFLDCPLKNRLKVSETSQNEGISLKKHWELLTPQDWNNRVCACIFTQKATLNY